MGETLKIKTRLQLREDLATLFTIEYAHLDGTDLLSEASAMFVVSSILLGLKREDILEIAGKAFDSLYQHQDLILSAQTNSLPDGVPEA